MLRPIPASQQHTVTCQNCGNVFLTPDQTRTECYEDCTDDETKTPTEKLKALRTDAHSLSNLLGKVCTYDDETTNDLITDAETTALSILFTIHDGDKDDITDAIREYFATK